MKFEDKGFLLSKNKYNENSVIAEFFTENYGKVSGLIFGATSSKIKSFYVKGKSFNIQFNSKNNKVLVILKLKLKKYIHHIT